MQIEVTPRPAPLGKTILVSLGVSAICGACFLPMIFDDSRRVTFRDDAVVIVLCSIVIGLVGSASFLAMRQKGGEFAGLFSLEQDCIRWQPGSGQVMELPYADLWSAGLEGRGWNESLILRGRQKESAIVVSKAAFPAPEIAEAFLKEILARVSHLPEGEFLHTRLEARRALSDQMDLGRKAVTLTLISILTLIFLVEVGIEVLEDPARLVDLGANAPSLVAKGEVFRLATANLLHAGWMHLLANMLGLFFLGFFLEPLLGKSRMLAMFLLSGLAGAALSAGLGSHGYSVGASACILGLYAAYVIVSWRWADQLPQPPMKRRWLYLIWVFFVVVVAGGSQVDHMGHLGGFVAGCLLMIPTLREADLSTLHLRHRRFFFWTACLLAWVYLLACAMIPVWRT